MWPFSSINNAPLRDEGVNEGLCTGLASTRVDGGHVHRRLHVSWNVPPCCLAPSSLRLRCKCSLATVQDQQSEQLVPTKMPYRPRSAREI